MERRKAEPGDLPRIVEITAISMPDDDTYLYEWPLHSVYPGVMESIWEFRLKKLLSKCHVIVEDGNVIAFAVWTQESHFPAEQRDECPPEDLAEKFKLVGSRTDVFEKASAWIRDRIKDAGIQEWFTMDLLVTDRPFRCRGAAAMLLEEFVKEAGGGYCLVEASRMGKPQYAKEGFEHVMDMPVKVKGEEEGTSVTVMWKQPTAAEITVRWSPPPPSPPLPPPLASLPEEDLSFMQTLKESDGRKMGFIK